MMQESYRSARKPHGVFLDEDGRELADTLQCCHCGGHFLVIKDSGKVRGFCMECDAVTCGSPRCHECLPFEKRMRLFEQGKIKDL